MLVLSDQVWPPDQGLTDVEAQVQETARRFAAEIVRLTFLVNEELGWGDTRLGWSLYGSGLALTMIENFRRDDLAELCPPGTISMWSISEPDYGSDMLDFSHKVSPPEVTNQAFEIFDRNATAKEYPIEKLLRDACMGTIAEGTNDVLSLMAVASRF